MGRPCLNAKYVPEPDASSPLCRQRPRPPSLVCQFRNFKNHKLCKMRDSVRRHKTSNDYSPATLAIGGKIEGRSGAKWHVVFAFKLLHCNRLALSIFVGGYGNGMHPHPHKQAARNMHALTLTLTLTHTHTNTH